MAIQTSENLADVDRDTIHRDDMQWYCVHCLTGQEQKAMRFLNAQVKNAEKSNMIGNVIMPTEKVTETKQGKKSTLTRKFFPGYLLIQASVYIVPDPSKPHKHVLNTDCWRFITDTPGIISFLGGETPIPLTNKEVDDIFTQQDESKDKARPKINYEPGEIVTILEGAFKGSSGPIEEVDPDRGRLKIQVTIFGQPHPVELEYWQVERMQVQTPAATIRG